MDKEIKNLIIDILLLVASAIVFLVTFFEMVNNSSPQDYGLEKTIGITLMFFSSIGLFRKRFNIFPNIGGIIIPLCPKGKTAQVISVMFFIVGLVLLIVGVAG